MTKAPDNDLLDVLSRRGKVQDFRSDPVPEAWADAIVAYGMRAPTSSNRQEYSLIRVDAPETRAELARIAGNQRKVVDCPLFYAVCADQTRMARAVGMHGTDYDASGLEGGLVATIDAALVGLTMSYVAESLGLGSTMIGALRNDAVGVARLLGLPPRCYVVFGLCIGWPASPIAPKPRHDIAAVCHRETYDAARHDAAIHAYDRDLAAHYRARGVTTPDAAWSEVMARNKSGDARRNLRAELRRLGLPFD